MAPVFIFRDEVINEAAIVALGHMDQKIGSW